MVRRFVMRIDGSRMMHPVKEKLFEEVIGRISKGTGLAAGGGCVALMIILLMGVVSRRTFHALGAWSYELSGFLFLVVVALALAYTQKERGHVGVEFLVKMLPLKARNIMALISYSLCLVYCGLLSWFGYRLLRYTIQIGLHSEEVEIPLAFVQFFLPLGLGLFMLQLITDIVKGVVDLGKTRG